MTIMVLASIFVLGLTSSISQARRKGCDQAGLCGSADGADVARGGVMGEPG